MLHTCGQTHFQMKLDSNDFTVEVNEINNYQPPSLTSTTIQLYTAYLGKVSVDVSISGNTISLEKYHNVNNKNILVKVLDATEHNLNQNRQYSINTLKSLSANKIDMSKNEYHYVLTLLTIKKLAQLNNNTDKIDKADELLKPFISNSEIITKVTSEYPELLTKSPKSSTNYKKIYQHVTLYNSSVDIFFNTCNYLTFLYEVSGIVCVNGLDALMSVNALPALDNAFFTGEYMMYGAGDKVFNPLTSIDVVGHELSHGLVSGTANLEYKGHSGAMNEAFSDIMGTMFEFYMYDTFPDLLGEADWFIGEDLGITKAFLRSMKNPNSANQPDKYQGKYYLNPNSQSDNGGVHINSGIINYCFYLACQQQNKTEILKTFLKCLDNLSTKSNFMDFRDQLKIVSSNNPIIMTSLNKIGLNDAAITDYGNYKQQSDCKHCPQHCQRQPRQQPRQPRQQKKNNTHTTKHKTHTKLEKREKE